MNNNIKIVKNCTGCYACKNICPRDCIEFSENQLGFVYPKIDETKCIGCGMCTKICPEINGITKSKSIEAYALKHKNEDSKRFSTSGGAFTALSDVILKADGIIYGVTMENGKVKHIRVDNELDRNKLRKSKYLQSKVEYIYRKVKADLQNKLIVLFTGTPCQIAALKSFLQKEYSNLYTCEVICHGVPSEKVFETYKKGVESKYKSKSINIDFRSKVDSWKSTMRIDFKKRKYIKRYDVDVFGVLFNCGYIMRESCYSCKYATPDRVADITMGDFWGIESLNQSFNSKSGISMVLINTLKGQKLLRQADDNVELLNVRVEDCVKRQEQLREPIKKAMNKAKFDNDFTNNENKVEVLNTYTKKIIFKNKIIRVLKSLGLLNLALRIKNIKNK